MPTLAENAATDTMVKLVSESIARRCGSVAICDGDDPRNAVVRKLFTPDGVIVAPRFVAEPWLFHLTAAGDPLLGVRLPPINAGDEIGMQISAEVEF